MAILWEGNLLRITDELTCDGEAYKNNPLIGGEAPDSSSGEYDIQTVEWSIPSEATNDRFGFFIGIAAGYNSIDCVGIADERGNTLSNVRYEDHAIKYTLMQGYRVSTGQVITGVTHWQGESNYQRYCVFYSNEPIFTSYEELVRYIQVGDNIEDAVNYRSEDEYDEETKYYWIYNQRGEADCVRNTATATGTQSWLSLKFQANAEPVLYYGSDYTLNLKASKVLASYSLPSPGYILDNVPESAWQDGLVTSGPFYGNIPSRLKATGEPLADGSYMYGFALNTNIYIFENEAKADAALENDDFSDAVNFESISGGNTYLPPNFGDNEEDQGTIFGSGGGESLFSTMHIFTTSQLRTFAGKVFDSTTSVVDAILDGLKLYGAEPINVIGNLKYFPFDLSRVCSSSSYNDIYFGSYKMEAVPHARVINMSGGGYIDAGTIFLKSLFNSYRDFEPYTNLNVYLPYIGWQKVDIGELINKSVNVRYYVDIITGRCVAVMLANGVMINYWNGIICADMMITATDARSYSSAALSSIGNGLSAPISGASKGVEAGINAGPYGAIAGGVIGGGLGLIGGGLQTSFELEKLGLPKDHIKQSGSNTGLIGMNMPQSVIWRYDIHEALEPTSFNDFCGRPSTASGSVGSFSGFLSCKQVRLNSSGMTEGEAKEILSLLKSGIFV